MGVERAEAGRQGKTSEERPTEEMGVERAEARKGAAQRTAVAVLVAGAMAAAAERVRAERLLTEGVRAFPKDMAGAQRAKAAQMEVERVGAVVVMQKAQRGKSARAVTAATATSAGAAPASAEAAAAPAAPAGRTAPAAPAAPAGRTASATYTTPPASATYTSPGVQSLKVALETHPTRDPTLETHPTRDPILRRDPSTSTVPPPAVEMAISAEAASGAAKPVVASQAEIAISAPSYRLADDKLQVAQQTPAPALRGSEALRPSPHVSPLALPTRDDSTPLPTRDSPPTMPSTRSPIRSPSDGGSTTPPASSHRSLASVRASRSQIRSRERCSSVGDGVITEHTESPAHHGSFNR